MNKIKLALVTTAASLLMSASAQAAPLLFTITDAAQTNPFSFVLNSMPTPNGEYTGNPVVGPEPYFTDVAGVVSDDAQDTLQYLTFYNSYDGGGVVASQNSPNNPGGDSPEYFDYSGTQIYTGTGLAPVFSPGVYNLVDQGNGGIAATLTISAAPEPSTWALMIAGIAGIGLALRQAKRKHSFTFAKALSA